MASSFFQGNPASRSLADRDHIQCGEIRIIVGRVEAEGSLAIKQFAALGFESFAEVEIPCGVLKPGEWMHVTDLSNASRDIDNLYVNGREVPMTEYAPAPTCPYQRSLIQTSERPPRLRRA
jgi:hypothetical protein